MKRIKNSTLAMLIIAVGLAVVAFVLLPHTSKHKKAPLKIAGYATAAELKAERNRDFLDSGPMIVHPITQVTVAREVDGKPLTMTLTRSGEGKDATWQLKGRANAPAVRHLVEKIASLFKTETISTFSTTIEENAWPVYDLEPAERIRLTLSGGAFDGVDLYVGKAVAGDVDRQGKTQYDTWVMTVDDPATLYRVVGKNMREPLALTLSDLRDKKVFAQTREDLTAIRVRPPGQPEVLLTRTTAPQLPGTPQPTAGPPTTWEITSPSGFVADRAAASLANSFANLRAKAFVPLGEAPPNALGARHWTITASTDDDGDLTIKVADGPVSDDPEATVWAQVTGRGEWMQLQDRQANSLRKSLEELRLKTLFDIKASAVTALSFRGPNGPISLARSGDQWQFTEPTLGVPADPSALLPSIVGLQAVRYARPSEVEHARAKLNSPNAKDAITGAITASGARQAVRFSAPIRAGKGHETDGKRWGIIGDPATGEPFLIADFNAKRLMSDVDKLRLKRVFPNRSLTGLRRIEISPPGAPPLILERADDTAAFSVSPDSPPLLDGQALDAGSVKTLTATAVGLAAASFPDDDASAGAAALLAPGKAATLLLAFADGTRGVLTISLSDTKGGHFAVMDSGPLKGIVIQVSGYQAKTLVQGPGALIKAAE